MTSLLGPAGVRGLELDGEGGPLRIEVSFMELFLFRCPPIPGAKVGMPLCMELDSEFCLLLSSSPLYSSPKKPCSFLWNLPLTLDLEPEEDTVVALAMEGRRSSPSLVKLIPFCGAKPGDIWPRLSVESL